MSRLFPHYYTLGCMGTRNTITCCYFCAGINEDKTHNSKASPLYTIALPARKLHTVYLVLFVCFFNSSEKQGVLFGESAYPAIPKMNENDIPCRRNETIMRSVVEQNRFLVAVARKSRYTESNNYLVSIAL
mmetsp:Transcript_3709/g.10526  ORF Transcript_3709/g.10526 Transcript_3709/m.10526 type:complete len:131 (-) Transcript_3709:1168-1560(-)